MRSFVQFRNAVTFINLLLLVLASGVSAQEKPAQRVSTVTPVKRVALVRAFIIDDRLSALRREPSLQSEIIRRLRLGHPVGIIRGKGAGRFRRIAVTRRTRGWIHESALAVPGRTGEDQRILSLAQANGDSIDRIALCRILIDHFRQSRLTPRAQLLIGEEADRAAETLGQRARRRLGEAARDDANVKLREYYLSDAGLDRYSKLHVVFQFNESTAEYIYDGKAYREIIRRFPDSDEAKLARERLEAGRQKMAQRK